MAPDPFTRELIQAVNGWQRGGSHAQKVRRGQRIKECAAALPPRFRTCEAACFRQEAHEKERVWQLLAANRAELSNIVIQKRLAISPKQSATGIQSGV